MQTNFNKFVAEYHTQLTNAVTKYPSEYAFGLEKVPQVVDNMTVAFKNATYNKDGRAIKTTCKILGIKHTYKDINAYLKG